MAAHRAALIRGRIRVVPELEVGVVSPDSRSLDRRTKRQDHERAGVTGYWLVDPERRSTMFLRLRGGRCREATCTRSAYASKAVPGFSLSLAPIRRAFEGLRAPGGRPAARCRPPEPAADEACYSR